MKHLLPTALAFLLVVGCGPDEPTNQELQIQIEINDSIHRQHFALLEQKITDVKRGADSTNKAVVWLGTQVMRHDSIVADRQWKRDRAERRGLFWGNLAKALTK